MSKYSLLGLLVVLLVGCRFAPNETQEYRHIGDEGWCVDSLVRVEVPVIDTVGLYDLAIGLRYTDDYPYSNLWLFITTVDPEGNPTVDTLNCRLADEYGRWLGSGLGVRLQQEVSFRKSMQFSRSGLWYIVVQQGMRDEYLPGITDVGVKVLPQ